MDYVLYLVWCKDNKLVPSDAENLSFYVRKVKKYESKD